MKFRLLPGESTGLASPSTHDTRGTTNDHQARVLASRVHGDKLTPTGALTMNDEALSHWEDLHNLVVTQTAQAFVTLFLTRCIHANTRHTAQMDLSIVPAVDMVRLLSWFKYSPKRRLLLHFRVRSGFVTCLALVSHHLNRSNKPRVVQTLPMIHGSVALERVTCQGCAGQDYCVRSRGWHWC